MMEDPRFMWGTAYSARMGEKGQSSVESLFAQGGLSVGGFKLGGDSLASPIIATCWSEGQRSEITETQHITHNIGLLWEGKISGSQDSRRWARQKLTKVDSTFCMSISAMSWHWICLLALFTRTSVVARDQLESSVERARN